MSESINTSITGSSGKAMKKKETSNTTAAYNKVWDEVEDVEVQFNHEVVIKSSH